MTPQSVGVVVLFAVGGLTAFAPAVTLARMVGPHRAEARFAATFIALTTMTLAITSGFYALHFRYYFSHWHGDLFTLRWAFEFGFTIAAALYQFAVLGIRLYFPFGLAALFAMSAWLAARPR